MRLADLPLLVVLLCCPGHLLKLNPQHSVVRSQPLSASEHLVVPVLLASACALQRWTRWLGGAQIRLRFLGVLEQVLETVLVSVARLVRPFKFEHTSWLLCEDIRGIVIVYYCSRNSYSRYQALETSRFL